MEIYLKLFNIQLFSFIAGQIQIAGAAQVAGGVSGQVFPLSFQHGAVLFNSGGHSDSSS